ncbi:MAG: serine/threonine-protein kinase [Bacteroidota bacterium]
MIGSIIENYEIDELIDEGGMGSIYLGVHKFLPRKAAIKALNPLLKSKPEIIERFRNEALILSKLQHPNIVSLYDYVENKEGNFIIMEYIDGENLAEYIETTTGPIPQKRTINLFLKVLDAVGHAHANNIIHRDIKPSNFIITPDNNVKVLDFGIAKSIDGKSKTLTKAGSKVGTTFFMSPQQVKGQVLDRRSDIYSLGVSLFQMVTGQPPYDEDSSEYDLYNFIINEPFPDPTELYVGVSEDMKKVIQKATAKRPLDRYQSCEEFSTALLGITKSSKIHIPIAMKTKIIDLANNEESKPPVLNRRFWRSLLLLIITALFVAAISVGIYYSLKTDMRHIIANEQSLYTEVNINSDYKEKLKFGEQVKVIGTGALMDKDGEFWFKVVSMRGNSGFIPFNNLARQKIYKQINSIFENNKAQVITPIFYKKQLRTYFVSNRLFNAVNREWKLFAMDKSNFEYNYIAIADFNNNDLEDFACVLKNNLDNSKKLLIFLDNSSKPIAFDYPESIKIKPIQKGRKGGAWYLGNYIKRNNQQIKSNKYEYLSHDGLLLYKEESKQTIVFRLNLEENIITFFEQPN